MNTSFDSKVYHHYATFIGLSILWIHHFIFTIMLKTSNLTLSFLIITLFIAAPMFSYILPMLKNIPSRVATHQKVSFFAISLVGILLPSIITRMNDINGVFMPSLVMSPSVMLHVLTFTSYFIVGLILITLMCYLVSRPKLKNPVYQCATDALLFICIGAQLYSIVIVGINFGGISYVVLFFTNSVTFFTILAIGITGRELIKNIHSHYEKQLNTDVLTNVFNRRGLYQDYDKFRSDIMPNEALVMLVLDIDYFKLFNDSYGHGKGDDCLVGVAKKLTSLGRELKGLTTSRYGGEEFVLMGVMDKTTANSLRDVDAVKNWSNVNKLTSFEHKSSPFECVTLSAGFSLFSHNEVKKNNFNTLFDRVDTLLYEAKKNRNSVMTELGMRRNIITLC